jgi:hypothetical protein
MKFKAIFSLFNGVLILSFLMIFLMPLFLLGADYFTMFWARNWAIAVVFVVTLAVLNTYFFMNWGLFKHLEREDWPRLVSFLEERILGRGQARRMYVRMLLNAYLITSNTEGIRALEEYLRKKKPALIGTFSVQFGIPYLLMKDPGASEARFAAMLADGRIADRNWIRWNRSFGLIQLGRREEARNELSGVLGSEREPVLRMLCLYLLDVCAGQDAETGKRMGDWKESLKKDVRDRDMGKRIEKASENVQVVILSKIVQDARRWLYAEGAATPQDPGAVQPGGQAGRGGDPDANARPHSGDLPDLTSSGK